MSELAKARSKYMTLPKQPGSQYTNVQRIAVISDYVVLGNQTKVAELHNIPLTTVHEWIKSEWGVALFEEIRIEKEPELDANLTRLIDSAFEEAEDRIKNGDFRLVKTKKAIKNEDGSLEVSEDYELKRIPMGGKELVISGATVYDKQRLHRNQPTSIITKDTPNLDAMVKKFEAIADAYNERQARVVSVQEKSEEESS